MRFKNVRDCHARFARRFDIDIAVRSRVEHCCDSCVIIADQIRKFGDAFGLNSFKDERHRSELTRSSDRLQPFVL